MKKYILTQIIILTSIICCAQNQGELLCVTNFDGGDYLFGQQSNIIIGGLRSNNPNAFDNFSKSDKFRLSKSEFLKIINKYRASCPYHVKKPNTGFSYEKLFPYNGKEFIQEFTFYTYNLKSKTIKYNFQLQIVFDGEDIENVRTDPKVKDIRIISSDKIAKHDKIITNLEHDGIMFDENIVLPGKKELEK